MKVNVYPVLALLVLALTLPTSATAERVVLLGAENTIYDLRQGTYADLFPEGDAVGEANGVLALDVVHADGSRERFLVPGTESQEVESSQIMVYEPETNSVYLFWQTVINGVHPNLYLTSFVGAGWGELFELSGNPFASKRSLQLVVSRDSTVEDHRALTVLHVFWSEEQPGTSVKRYAPIFIIEGSYLRWTPVYSLDAFFPSTAPSDGPISAGIADVVRAQVGRNRRTSAVGYLDPSTHRLATLEIELFAPELSSLADKIRAEIIWIGVKTKDREELSGGAREKILELGTDFHPATLGYMADRVQEMIESTDHELTDEDLAVIADQVWTEIVAVGSTIGENGVVDMAESKVLEVAAPWDEGPGHLIKVSWVSDREAPEVGGEAALWLSESARDVLVTWEEGDRIFYRESVDDGWGEPAFLEVSDELSREKIYATLAERARGR